MISPELLRRYPFFGKFDDAQLKQIAMLAEEGMVDKGQIIFKEGDQASFLYILVNGSVELYFHSEEKYHPQASKELYAGEINPGEVFGISSLLEPFVLNASGRAAQNSIVVKIDAAGLHRLMEADRAMGCLLLLQTAKTLRDRLDAARVQLAAAWAS